MPERVVQFTLMLGESSDKPTHSGRAIQTELRGLVCRLPADDDQGSAVTSPGARVIGDDTFTFLPGVHGEPGTISAEEPLGIPASPASASIYFGKVRIVVFSDPGGAKGNLIGAFYSSDSEDNRTGKCLLMYQTLWGGRLPGGEKIRPYQDPNAPLVLLTPTQGEEIPGSGCPAAEIEFTWSDVDGELYELFISYESSTMPGAPYDDTTSTTYNYSASTTGVYYWWVRVTYSDGEISTIGPAMFEIVSE